MKKSIKSGLIASLLALVLVGCTTAPIPPDSSASHPANAHGAQGIVPPPIPMLMSLTNMGNLENVSRPVPEHQHESTQHGTKTETEEKK